VSGSLKKYERQGDAQVRGTEGGIADGTPELRYDYTYAATRVRCIQPLFHLSGLRKLDALYIRNGF
jgi:hypothetical protein